MLNSLNSWFWFEAEVCIRHVREEYHKLKGGGGGAGSCKNVVFMAVGVLQHLCPRALADLCGCRCRFLVPLPRGPAAIYTPCPRSKAVGPGAVARHGTNGRQVPILPPWKHLRRVWSVHLACGRRSHAQQVGLTGLRAGKERRRRGTDSAWLKGGRGGGGGDSFGYIPGCLPMAI